MPLSNTNDLSTFSALLDSYNKARGTSTTTTSASNISSAGVDALVKQILNSTQGLASVSQGQRSAGLYNSTTNQLLTNDLISTTAQKVAAATAGTTTTQQTSGALSGSNARNALLLMAGKSLLGPSASGAAKKIGFTGPKDGQSIGDWVADQLGVGTPSPDAVSGSTNLFDGVNPTDFTTDTGSNLAGGEATSWYDGAGGDVVDSVSSSATDNSIDEGLDVLGGFFG